MTEKQAKKILKFLGKRHGYNSFIIFHVPMNMLRIRYYVDSSVVSDLFSCVWYLDDCNILKILMDDASGEDLRRVNRSMLSCMLEVCKRYDLKIDKLDGNEDVFLKRGSCLENILIEMDMQKG